MPFNTDALQAPYIVEEIKVRYLFDSGKVFNAIAYSPGGGNKTAVSTQVSKPQNLREVTFLLTRAGVPPVLPECAAVLTGEELAFYDVTTDRAGRDSRGTPTYQLQGRIVFRRLDDVIPTPEFPKSLSFTDPTPPGITGP